VTFALEPEPAPHDDQGKAWWPTPPWAVEALLDEHPLPSIWVIEPSAGEGPIAEVLARRGHLVSAVEVRPECWLPLSNVLPGGQGHLVTIDDWLAKPPAKRVPAMVEYSIMGNPPHDPADTMLAHVAHAVASEALVVALLLPTTFLHSVGRLTFNREYPVSALYPLARRPACRSDGERRGGKRDLSWFVWDKQQDLGTQVVKTLV
jgi:hypothetical protein